jgi:hypothetical protein
MLSLSSPLRGGELAPRRSPTPSPEVFLSQDGCSARRCRTCKPPDRDTAQVPERRTGGHRRTALGPAVINTQGQPRGVVEIRNYLRDQAGSRSLVFDLSITQPPLAKWAFDPPKRRRRAYAYCSRAQDE